MHAGLAELRYHAYANVVESWNTICEVTCNAAAEELEYRRATRQTRISHATLDIIARKRATMLFKKNVDEYRRLGSIPRRFLRYDHQVWINNVALADE